MKYQIRPARQVIEFTSALPPAGRARCKRALAGLADWNGNIVPLQSAALCGYYRLRVESSRFIFAVKPGLRVEVVYANERALVYQLFEQLLKAGEFTPLT